jgi:hypothetical protein
VKLDSVEGQGTAVTVAFPARLGVSETELVVPAKELFA